jgi:hypothetical protein
MSEIQRPRDRVEELEGLLGIGRDDLAPIRAAFRIRGHMLTITGLLLKREGSVTYETMTIALQNVHSDEPVDKRVVSAVICGLRKRLPPTVRITTDWGVGFYMDRESKGALRRVLEAWR